MPKIYAMRREPEIEIHKLPIKHFYATVPLPRLEGMLFGCICGHWNITHKENGTGECWHNETDLCICKKFTPQEFKILVEITNADLFNIETENKFEEDSFEWWNNFNLWRIRNENKESPILCDDR